jgi:hypothetical protein
MTRRGYPTDAYNTHEEAEHASQLIRKAHTWKADA